MNDDLALIGLDRLGLGHLCHFAIELVCVAPGWRLLAAGLRPVTVIRE
jgi:hypothetical protein